ncbi:MAG TPA: tail fiber protein [Bryobacteraceae bacterium]|nr:tail fiber protein [Bryobacteraceae bacterium]
MAEGYIGEVRIFAGNNIPQGWLACNGQSLNISEYEGLYSLIGTQYGGSGATFNLPNLQGKLVAGYGQGPGLTGYTLGQNFGSYAVTLSANQTAHVHAMQASTAAATSLSPVNGVFAALPSPSAAYVPNNAGTTLRQFDGAMLSSEGSNQAHSNVMPCLAFNYIICVNGLYPTFN